MNELDYGTRNERGDWIPTKLWKYPPVFVWPPQPLKFLKWLLGFPGYLYPWNAFYFAVAFVLWWFLTPSATTLQTFSLDWIGFLLARNAILIFVFVGLWHHRLYIQRKQGTRFKYNPNWPDTKRSVFLFHNQNWDNIFRTFVFAVPIWTGYEAGFLWAYANGYLPTITFESNPIYFIVLMVLIPLWYNLHFYTIHRLLHWPPLYHRVHKTHHYNANPGPWSGLAMHPVELLLYFSVPVLLLLIPAHPLHAVFILTFTALSPAYGHMGFEKMVIGESRTIDSGKFAHYLHHKFFECNYADGIIPLDKWFGTYHDGSAESETRLRQCLKQRMTARMNDGKEYETS